MVESFWSDISEDEIRRQRNKAKELKKTAWWKRKKENGICHYCQKSFSPKELTMDHLIPIIRGGKSIKSNLVPACKECNDKKKYQLPMEMKN